MWALPHCQRVLGLDGEMIPAHFVDVCQKRIWWGKPGQTFSTESSSSQSCGWLHLLQGGLSDLIRAQHLIQYLAMGEDMVTFKKNCCIRIFGHPKRPITTRMALHEGGQVIVAAMDDPNPLTAVLLRHVRKVFHADRSLPGVRRLDLMVRVVHFQVGFCYWRSRVCRHLLRAVCLKKSFGQGPKELCGGPRQENSCYGPVRRIQQDE
mmetsp:Transcript_9369/g.17308  ORF Transcript_9369/g.17308 Transcript_9369/m.17308 type:complete len:207 (+) Transcript_9369:1303-1923(+)